MSTVSRGNWNSRFGFILAAAGSAIGLGNIWRFPYTAGQYGGGAFVLLYLFFVFVIGLPVLLAELSVGRETQKSPVSAFKALKPGTGWSWVGGLGVLTGFGILSFYAVIAGVTLGYVYLSVTGKFSQDVDAAAVFADFTANGPLMIILSAVFMGITALIVQKGIGGGIERAAKILMPTFFVFLLFLVIRGLFLDGAAEGLRFMFAPDFSKLTGAGVVSALGQALFSLSLGMGAMITYGSYLSKDENIPVSGVSVAIFDTSIALLGGLLIFPTLFHAGVDPAAGPGLVFVVMASVFDSLPGGSVFSVVFYSLLSIAAVTSTISLMEVITSYFIDDRGWSRSRSTWTVAAACFALSVPSALSLGASEYFSTFWGGGFLNLMDNIWGNYSLPIGATLLCFFVAWSWGVPNALASIEDGGHKLPASAFWSVLIRFVCPAAVLLVFGYTIWQQLSA